MCTLMEQKCQEKGGKFDVKDEMEESFITENGCWIKTLEIGF